MIGRLKGILLEKIPPQLLLDISGIAYELDAPLCTFYRLPEIGEEVTLYTHLIVREDAQLLYGFSQEQERTLFRNLIKISAIGPKLALAILSGIEPNNFVHCIMNDDISSLTRIPGIGKKTAERLVIEMRDRVSDWHTKSTEMTDNPHAASISNKIVEEAIGALVSLGYKPLEARRTVTSLTHEYQSSEELIRHALQGMMQRGK